MSTTLNKVRVWNLPASSQTSAATNILRARSNTSGTFAVDFTERLNQDTVLASAVVTNASLTIGAPVISGDQRHVEFAITGGIVEGFDYMIEVVATYGDGTQDAVECILRADG